MNPRLLCGAPTAADPLPTTVVHLADQRMIGKRATPQGPLMTRTRTFLRLAMAAPCQVRACGPAAHGKTFHLCPSPHGWVA